MMEKPKKPIEPNINDKGRYPDTHRSMRNMTPEEIENIPYIKAYKQYALDKAQYDKDIQVYEQIKLIRLVKNASEKYCLKKLKIEKYGK